MATQTVLVKANVPLPKLTRTTVPGSHSSIYDFAALAEGECYLDFNVIDIKKAKARMQSAVGAWRSRTNDKTTLLAVRSYKDDEGKDVVGVWKLAPEPVAEAPAEDAPAAE